MNKKIRIAFVKFGGMSAGGSEKLLQIIAASLPKDEFTVDYYYCDAAPYKGSDYKHPTTDSFRLAFVKAHGVNVIQFHVGAKDITKPTHPWIDTDFWQLFDEKKYDIIQMCRAGHKEYPFTKIRRTPLVDIIALSGMVDNQYNIARVMHICQWNANHWIAKGGDSSRVALVSLPISMPHKDYGSFRQELGIAPGTFVYGMHQRPDDSIFSVVPLEAYQKIETDDTAFVLLGGGLKYRAQATELGIKHIHFLPATGDMESIGKFLSTLNVYAHGRRDGEVNSQSMAEAMFFELPIVSHYSDISNGHVECIGNSGVVVHTTEEYAAELVKLKTDQAYDNFRSDEACKRFAEKYELQGQMKNFVQIYHDVVNNPFPHQWRRLWSSLHYTQHIRRYLAAIYLFVRYSLRKDLLKYRQE